MSDEQAAMHAPGWRADPADPALERWWDGLDWGEHVRVREARVRLGGPREPVIRALSTETPQLSALVSSPIWVGFLYWSYSIMTVPFMVLPMFSTATPSGRFSLKLLFIVVMIVVLAIVAAFDAAELRRRDVRVVPHPLWALATPVAYLWVRRRVTASGDVLPFRIHLALCAVTLCCIAVAIAAGLVFLAY